MNEVIDLEDYRFRLLPSEASPHVENSEHEYEPFRAGSVAFTYGSSIFFRRWAATWIDMIILMMSSAIISVSIYQESIAVSILPLLFLLSYYLLLEGLTGFTVGKYLLRIQVVKDDGRPPGFGKSILRTAMRLIETNPFLLGMLPAGLTVLLSKHKQRLGDKVVDTYVLRTKDLPERSSRSKRVTTGLIIAAVVYSLLSVGIGIYTYVDASVNGVPTKSFISSDGQYQLVAKYDWREIADLHEDASLSIGNIFDEKYLYVLSDAKRELPEGITLEDMEATLEEAYEEELWNSWVEKPHMLEINGYPAYQFTVFGHYEGYTITSILTAIETPTHYYRIAAWMETSSYDELGSEIRSVINSLNEIH